MEVRVLSTRFTFVQIVLYIRNLLFSAAFVAFSASKPIEAGIWDHLKRLYEAILLGEFDEAGVRETPVKYAGEVGLVPFDG